MAGTAFLRYSHRVATQRPGARYELRELWQVPQIENTGGAQDDRGQAWEHEALTADGLPKLGELKHDGGWICTSVDVRSLDHQGTADVEVRYCEDPLTLVTEVHYFSQSKPKPAWQGIAQRYGGPDSDNKVPAPDEPPTTGDDQYDDPFGIHDIRNSAGDRYNPPVTYDVPLERIEVTFRASLSYHDKGIVAGEDEPATAFVGNWDDYVKHWNAEDWEVTQIDPDNDENTSSRIFPAGTVMLIDKRAPLVKEPYFHRLVTLTFLYDPDMWCHRLPDMGPRCKKYLCTRDGVVQQIQPPGYPVSRVAVTDTMGRPFGGSAELDGQGHQLIPNADGTMPPAVIYMWWPVDDDGNILSADFNDIQPFTPELPLILP